MKPAFFNCLSLVYKYAVTKIKGIKIIPNFEKLMHTKGTTKVWPSLTLKNCFKKSVFLKLNKNHVQILMLQYNSFKEYFTLDINHS